MKRDPRFQFGNVVVVEDGLIGVVLKTWNSKEHYYTYDIYVRLLNSIRVYPEGLIRHFIYSKELSNEEKEFYHD